MASERLTTDKLTETYTLRVPEILKDRVGKLSKTQTGMMNERILVVMAQAVHDAAFDPSYYLTTEDL